jgi:hypothetical protein
MALSFDIRLPKDYVPVFPNRCVYSDEPSPDYNAAIFANGQNALAALLLPFMMLFGWRRLTAPILKKYRWRFYAQRYGRELLSLIVLVGVIWVIHRWLPPGTKGRYYKGLALCCLAYLPWIILDSFFPRCFSVTAHGQWIDYEFASPAYAAEFQLLNHRAVIAVS